MLDGGNAFGVIGQMVGAVRQLIDEGGPFVFWIFACGVVLWTLVLERWWFFMRILPQLSRDAQTEWSARADRSSWCARQIRQAMISRLNVAMTTGFPLLQVLVPLSPLRGLIGTVSGMRAVKSLALENLRKKSWDNKVVNAIRTRTTVFYFSTAGLVVVQVLQKLMTITIMCLGITSVQGPDRPPSYYEPFPINPLPGTQDDRWQQIEYRIPVPPLEADETLKFYLWNKDLKARLLVDDVFMRLSAARPY